MWFVIFICILFCNSYKQVLVLILLGCCVEAYNLYLENEYKQTQLFIYQKSTNDYYDTLNKLLDIRGDENDQQGNNEYNQKES